MSERFVDAHVVSRLDEFLAEGERLAAGVSQKWERVDRRLGVEANIFDVSAKAPVRVAKFIDSSTRNRVQAERNLAFVLDARTRLPAAYKVIRVMRDALDQHYENAVGWYPEKHRHEAFKALQQADRLLGEHEQIRIR